jgi:hypothetical protein
MNYKDLTLADIEKAFKELWPEGHSIGDVSVTPITNNRYLIQDGQMYWCVTGISGIMH